MPDKNTEEQPLLQREGNTSDPLARYEVDGDTLRDISDGGKPVQQCRPGHTYDI